MVRLFSLLTGYQVGSLAAALCEQIRVEEGWRHVVRGVSTLSNILAER